MVAPILDLREDSTDAIPNSFERAKLFAVMWVTYVAFYICRLNLGVVIPALQQAHLSTTTQNAHLVLGFSVAYFAALFPIGALADRVGARKTLIAGMLLSAFATGAMGLSSHYWHFLVWQIVNGVAQASGWVGLMKMMKLYPMHRRGVVMGWWSTNYVVGGFAATLFASYALQISWGRNWGWRTAMCLPAGLLTLYAVAFSRFTRGSSEISHEESPGSGIDSWLDALRLAFSMNRIRTLAMAYFFSKLIRYSLLFWLPLCLVNQLGVSPAHAGNTASWMSGIGVPGLIAGAYLSDHVFGERRFPVAMWMMLTLAAICILASRLHAGLTGWSVIAIVGLLGCAMYGADTLLAGAATQDAASATHIGKISGIVNSAGSIGQILSPLFVTAILGRWGWPVVFEALGGAAVLCAIVLAFGRQAELTDGKV